MIRKTLVLSFAIMFLVVTPAHADFEKENWQYYKKVEPEKKGFSLIRLDQEVLTRCQNNLNDLRLVSSQGDEVPYKLIQVEPSTMETYPVQIINDVVRENEFSAVTLDMERTARLNNNIMFEITSKDDYLRDVLIEGSNDNQNWDTIIKSKIFRVGNNGQDEVSYPPASYRYIRVKIDCKGKEPLDIKEVKVRFIPKKKNDFNLITAKTISNRQDPETKTSEIIADLGVKGIYVNDISLQVSNDNFDRGIEGYYSYDKKEWHAIGSGRIFNYSWTDYSASQENLPIHERVGRYVKIRIQNQDSPPLNVKGIEVRGRYPALLADLNNENHYLWYGNLVSEFARYDLNRFAHLVDLDDLPEINPGSENINDKYVAKETSKRNLLNIITVAAVIVVGFIILKNLTSKK
ncbi:MAG: discoidin domain-containing protein [Firmicutes bacterium]|nr:discoidin domain-containing protein [Bacillota bacterium]